MEHLDQLRLAQPAVTVLVDDVFRRKALRLRAGLLLRSGVTKAHQADGKDVTRQVKKLAVDLVILHDVTNVAAPQPQRLRCHHRGLRGDQRIAARQEQIPLTRVAAFLTQPGAQPIHPARGIVILPALVIRQEQQHQRGFGNERLIIAGHRQPGLERRILHLNDCVQHLVASGWRAQRCLQNLILHAGADGLIGIIAHRFAPHQQRHRRISRLVCHGSPQVGLKRHHSPRAGILDGRGLVLFNLFHQGSRRFFFTVHQEDVLERNL